MNDDQTLNQSTNPSSAVSGTQAQAQDPVQNVQDQPQASVGSVHKEQGPAQTFVERSDVELKIDKELEDIGVEAKTDNVNLTAEHTQAGLEHAGASVPVTTVPSGNVQLPQTPLQIKTDIKKTKPTDSLRGLLLEILKNIQRVGLKEQKD